MGVGSALVGTGSNVWDRFIGDAARPDRGNGACSDCRRAHWSYDYGQRSAVRIETL
jgi:hypothetical protein